MKNYIYILILGLSLFVGSCYEDKGNYDYIELNDIIVTGIEEEYVVTQFDTIQIAPTILQKFYPDLEGLEYLWHMYPDGRDTYTDTLSFEKDLNINLGSSPGDYTAIYEVTDGNTGVFYKFEFAVKVVNNYSDGIMILSEVEDHAASVSFINIVGDTYTDLFITANGKIAGHHPTKLGHGHFHERTDNGAVFIFCADGIGGSITEAAGFKEIGTYSDLFWAPDNGGYPTDYKNYGFFYDDGVIDNGQLYWRYWMSLPPVRYQLSQTPDAELYPNIFLAGFHDMLVYDNKEQRFMAKDLTAASPVKERPDNAFDPANVGLRMIWGDQGYSKTGYGIFLDETTSDQYILSFSLTGKNPQGLSKQKLPDGLDYKQFDAIAVSYLSPQLIYSIDNKLYCWDQATEKITETFAFPENETIDFVEFDPEDHTKLYVGTMNGSIIHKSCGSLHIMNLSPTGSVELSSSHPGIAGKIVDVLNKKAL